MVIINAYAKCPVHSFFSIANYDAVHKNMCDKLYVFEHTEGALFHIYLIKYHYEAFIFTFFDLSLQILYVLSDEKYG
jgi:hypothetical protein